MFERTKKSPWKLLENVPQKSLKSPWKRYVMICGNHGDIFDFSSETTKRNCRKLDRKQDLNVLYQVCVFRADRKNKMAALASHWLRHFRLLLWNHWKKFYETWQEARSQRPLSSLCFSGRSEKQDGRPGLWLAETFSTSILKPLNGIQRNLTGSKISTSSIKFVFFGPIGRTRWPLWPLIGWDIFDFSSETTERNSKKLDRKQDLNVLYQICVFLADRKNKMAALASHWLRHFRLLLWNHWKKFYETWQEARSQRPLSSLCFSGRSKKQDGRPGLWLAETFSTSPLKPLNRIQQNLTGSKISTSSINFGFFRADQKNKMAALASDWLRYFRLLLWSHWTEFNETWQEARSQRPLSSLCFSGRSEKQDGRPGLSLSETFSTSPLKPLKKILRNLTGSKISTSSTKFVFFGPIRKIRWPPWPLIGWDIFDFSSETAERNSTKLDRKQDLNILYQVCVFRADRKNKMAALTSDWLRPGFPQSLKSPWILGFPWKVLENEFVLEKSLNLGDLPWNFKLVVLDFLFCIFWTESLNGHSKWRGTRANFPQKKFSSLRSQQLTASSSLAHL